MMMLKIQCGCGVKYAFEVTEASAEQTFQLVCESCGTDNSEEVTRIVRHQLAGAVPGAAVPEAVPSPAPCLKHPGQVMIQNCLVCQKPMCPQCMEAFGHLCSAYCRTEAEDRRMVIPAYVKPGVREEAKVMRRVKRVCIAAALVVFGLIAFWTWFSIFASKPSVAYAVSFAEPDHDGFGRLVEVGQVLVGHGDRLARHDVREGRELWSVELGGRIGRVGGYPEGIEIICLGTDIWAGYPHKVVRFDWLNGEVRQEIALMGKLVRFESGEGYLSLTARDDASGRTVLSRVSLEGGAVVTEEVPPESRFKLAARRISSRKVSEVVLGEGFSATDHSRTEFVDAGRNFLRFEVDWIESVYERVATIKAKGKTSELETVSGATASRAMNEVLNDMARDAGDGFTLVDNSRYNVSLARLQSPGSPEWKGEVAGPPILFPMQTVDLLVAGKRVLALTKQNRLLWESSLNYRLEGEGSYGMELEGVAGSRSRARPCVEKGSSLYLHDQGVLTAFEVQSGAVRWRLPSVGISSVQFDDQGMLYVMTTDAGVDSIQYADQVDVNRKVVRKLMKVDPGTGRILWEAPNRGYWFALTGGFLYAVEGSSGEEDVFRLGLGVAEHTRVYRLDPEDGRTMWEYYNNRAALGMDFKLNSFLMRFDDGMQVLGYRTL